MFILEQNKHKWLSLWEYTDLTKRYVEDYNHRKDSKFFDPRVDTARRNCIEKYISLNKCFDYGCGGQPFYNLNEVGGYWDKYTIGFTTFSRKNYLDADCLMMFDVLEHMFDPYSFLLTLPHKMLYVTLPIYPGILESEDNIKNWKHYRPGEHIWYWTEPGFIEFCDLCGWELLYNGHDECPPRKDIGSFIFKRK